MEKPPIQYLEYLRGHGKPPAPPSFDKDGFCQRCRRKNGYCRCHDKILESPSVKSEWSSHDNTAGWFAGQWYLDMSSKCGFSHYEKR